MFALVLLDGLQSRASLGGPACTSSRPLRLLFAGKFIYSSEKGASPPLGAERIIRFKYLASNQPVVPLLLKPKPSQEITQYQISRIICSCGHNTAQPQGQGRALGARRSCCRQRDTCRGQRPSNVVLHCAVGLGSMCSHNEQAPPQKKRLSSEKRPIAAGSKDFPAAAVGTSQFSLQSSQKSFLSARSGFPGWVLTGQLVQSRKGYVRASEHEKYVAQLWRSAHRHAESAGRPCWLRQGQGSPVCPITSQRARVREALQSSTVRDNLREGAGQGRGGGEMCLRQTEPSISKGRTGAQRGHENHPPPPPLLSVFVSFYLPSAA